jgi:hypothetical protein
MDVKQIIKTCLELDDQVIHPRPSWWLEMAQLIHELATHAEPSFRPGPGPDVFGEGWEKVNVSSDRKCNDRTGWDS